MSILYHTTVYLNILQATKFQSSELPADVCVKTCRANKIHRYNLCILLSWNRASCEKRVMLRWLDCCRLQTWEKYIHWLGTEKVCGESSGKNIYMTLPVHSTYAKYVFIPLQTQRIIALHLYLITVYFGNESKSWFVGK